MVKSEEFVYFLKTVLFQFYMEFRYKTPTKALLFCVSYAQVPNIQ